MCEKLTFVGWICEIDAMTGWAYESDAVTGWTGEIFSFPSWPYRQSATSFARWKGGCSAGSGTIDGGAGLCFYLFFFLYYSR